MTLSDKVDSRLTTIERRLDRPDISGEIEADIEDKLRDVYQRYSHLEQDDAFEDHVTSYIEREADRDDRETALCTCGDQLCPLRSGKVPNPGTRTFMTGNPSLRFRLNKWRHNHSGRAVVLEEALEEWSKEYADLLVDIAEIKGMIGRVVTNGTDVDSSGDEEAAIEEEELAIEEVKTRSYNVPFELPDGDVIDVTITGDDIEDMAEGALGVIEVVGKLKAAETPGETEDILREYGFDPSRILDREGHT